MTDLEAELAYRTRHFAMDAEIKRAANGQFGSGADVLKKAGLAHKPGSGYKPELNAYQSYAPAKPVPHENIVQHLKANGFKPSYQQGSGKYMDKLSPMMGGLHVSSWERSPGPYQMETVELHSKNGKDVHNAVHSKHRAT